MARDEARIKLGYYPLPEGLYELIRSNINFPFSAASDKACALDPFAGDGLALAALFGDQMKTFGNELDAGRAKEAKKHLDKVVRGPVETLYVDGKASILYFNPPYDVDIDGGRVETRYLETCMKFMRRNGLFIGILPMSAMRDKNFIVALSQNFSEIEIRRFPHPEYDVFKQVVVFGLARYYSGYADSAFVNNTLMAAANPEANIPIIETGEFSYHYPEALIVHMKQSSAVVAAMDADAILREKKGGALESARMKMLLDFDRAQKIRPLMKPMPAHVAMLLAAGAINDVVINGCVIRGFTRRWVEQSMSESESGEPQMTETERIAYRISSLNVSEGKYYTYDSVENPDEYESFIAENLDVLMAEVIRRYKPIYDGNIPQAVNSLISKIRAPMEVNGKRQIFPAQREVIAGLIAGFRSGEKGLFLEGEMGVGKTLISISVALVLGSFYKNMKTVVIFPPHLAKKWKREIENVGADFGAKAFLCETVTDVQRAFAETGHVFVLLTQQSAKNNSKWQWAVNNKNVFSVVGGNVKPANRYLNPEAFTHSNPHGYGYIMEEKSMVNRPLPCCPNCGKPYAGDREVSSNYRAKCEHCGSPLWSQVPFAYGGRYALAEFISQHYSKYLFINDEAHQTKGGDTDIGYACRDLASSSRFTLQMTGTLSNGYASGIFHMAHRGSDAFRRMFGYNEVTKFVAMHGFLQRVVKIEKGKYSSGGYVRGKTLSEKETPGTSPSIVAMLLSQTAFIHLDAIAENLPSVDEFSLPITAKKGSIPMKNLGDIIDGTFRDRVLQISAATKSFGKLSQWMQASLQYMDAPQHGESFLDGEFEIAPYDGENEKYDAIHKLITKETGQGRRVLIYWMQVNRRSPIEKFSAGLNVPYAVLRKDSDDSILPNGKTKRVKVQDREEFIEKAVSMGAKVLMCSPELVQTGLDLVAFSTVVFASPHYSTLLLRQASARLRRPGQTQNVKIIWSYWNNTRQCDALALVSKKMHAADLIHGALGSGVSAYIPESSFASELVRRATGANTPQFVPYEL